VLEWGVVEQSVSAENAAVLVLLLLLLHWRLDEPSRTTRKIVDDPSKTTTVKEQSRFRMFGDF